MMWCCLKSDHIYYIGYRIKWERNGTIKTVNERNTLVHVARRLKPFHSLRHVAQTTLVGTLHGAGVYTRRMKKAMEAITVETNEDGKILLSSPDFGGGEPIIMVDPAQVPALIEWRKEAAEELKPR